MTLKKIAWILWRLISTGLMIIGAIVVIHVTILVIHNATSTPPEPPGGWKPLPGDENYAE